MLGTLVLIGDDAARNGSAWRDGRGLASPSAPLMRSIVPLIFLLFVIPGIVFGYVSGSVQEPSRHHPGHGQGHERHGLLHRHGLLRRPVHLRLRRSRTSAR
jgi:hypothetical protein